MGGRGKDLVVVGQGTPRSDGHEEAPIFHVALESALACPRGGMWIHVAGNQCGPIPKAELAAFLQNELRDAMVGVMGMSFAVIVRQMSVEEQDLCTAELERGPSDGTRRVFISFNGLPTAGSMNKFNLARVVIDRVLEVRARHKLET
uniref:Uncharacterized protein n=1 Tax=Mucochytrium quahogii TaxID=96639 RepID=A0A7S2RPX0_9STRA|mmetsp:Transcript_18289/g.39692  ORF Transcript_18289/g.39692 Transcript_18289/m.39692 type:complete len:147 (+) Transcript_18289:110-550(+)